MAAAISRMQLSIHGVAAKYIRSIVAAAEDVINRAFIFQPAFSRHLSLKFGTSTRVQNAKFDPFDRPRRRTADRVTSVADGARCAAWSLAHSRLGAERERLEEKQRMRLPQTTKTGPVFCHARRAAWVALVLWRAPASGRSQLFRPDPFRLFCALARVQSARIDPLLALPLARPRRTHPAALPIPRGIAAVRILGVTPWEVPASARPPLRPPDSQTSAVHSSPLPFLISI